ncbi:butyrophilin subfamily 2 member A2-like isoform 2-T2 [Pholidichthys leucotaenia]
MGRWMILLFVMLCGGFVSVSNSLSVSVESPPAVNQGHTVNLPCWYGPAVKEEDLEVRWYRGDQFETPIIHYKHKKLQQESLDSSYIGRVSFGLKDESSGGVQIFVGLTLENVTIKDEGDYTCYVTSLQSYESASLQLTVTETGSQPVLSPVWTEDNTVNVSCESEGWYPQPVLSWSDQKQVKTFKSLTYSNTSSGLVSVHSWILVPSSSELSCSVGLSDKEKKEARLRLGNPPQLAERKSDSSLGGWVAFGLLLIATVVLAALGLWWYRKKGKSAHDHPEEVVPHTISAAREHYVNVELENPNHPYLKIRGTILRDNNPEDQPFPDGEEVTCLTAIRGTPGFSSGKHYWEVSLARQSTAIKQSWWLGVTSRIESLQELKITPNTSNGFWFLSSSPKRPDHLKFSAESKALLFVRSRPETVGVFLDYDKGELSFYNVEESSLIVSFIVTFTGQVFPFFNPGKGDEAPMEILHKRECSQSGEQQNTTGNCNVSTPLMSVVTHDEKI